MSIETSLAFPTLNLRNLTERGPQRRMHLEELRAVAHDFGAFSLVEHGIDACVADGVLAVSRRVFALSDAQLARIAMIDSPHFRGYVRVGNERTQGRADWREQIEIGPDLPPRPRRAGDAPYWLLHGPNLWPAEVPEFRTVILDWMTRLRSVAATLLGAIAESLGLSHDYFADAFARDPHAHLKVVRYPGGDATHERQGVGAHKDYGFLTLLIQDDVGGLQFLHDGTFVDVPTQRGAFVINLGELLEAATRGYLTATTHRVLSPPAGVERISVPYFYNPRLDFVVEPIPLPVEITGTVATLAKPDDAMFVEYGRNALRGWFRSHPAIAQLHHAELLS